MDLEIFTITTAAILCGLVIIHAIFDGSSNRIQRLLMLATLFIYGIFLEYIGIMSGHHFYAEEAIMFFEVVPLSIPLAWVGIIYSAMIIAEHLKLSLWMRILTTTFIALSLDWGMDPISVELGLWTWTYEGGSFFGIPSFNFTGWFIIPVAFLIPYNLTWNNEKKKLRILTIREIDNNDSMNRKIYTLFLVVPLGLILMIGIGSITLLPFFYNLPIAFVIIFEVLTILIASITIIFNFKNLKRAYWYDLLPPIILIFVAYGYIFLGFFTNQIVLSIHMIITAFPLILVLIFSLLKKK